MSETGANPTEPPEVLTASNEMNSLANEVERLRQENIVLRGQLAKRNDVDSALVESDAKFRHIYDNSPVMMHSIDKDGNICNVNKKWLENTGYSREEVIGQRADFLMTPESAERAFKEVIPQFWRDGYVRNISYKYVRKNSEVFDALLDCNATTDPEGKNISLSVTRDVTEKNRVEAELQQYQERLEQLVQERTAELESVLGELRSTQEKMVHQARMASLGIMVAGFAHEVRNPLNFTIGGTRNIEQQIEKLKQLMAVIPIDLETQSEIDYCLKKNERALELLNEGNNRIAGIVGHLQEFSESRSQPLNERCDLGNAINATLILVRDLVQQNDIRVQWTNPKIAEVPGNRVELNQVLMNIIMNACQAMPNGGCLTIEVQELEQFIQLTFQDDGPGIPLDIRPKVFDPFFTTRQPGDGTGLGLSISHNIMKRHGGEILLGDSPEGTLFILSIPRTGTPERFNEKLSTRSEEVKL